ncbi:hypothetical protein [Streptomyces sioyaensis]|uniref:hypothetical protein n=1 Tax=Streptomyces sioyaensis TaxID=67364 RepID=UPI00378BF799
MSMKPCQFRKVAVAAAVSLTLAVGGLVGAPCANAAAPTSRFVNWSCGYNGGRGLDPGSDLPAKKATTAHSDRLWDNSNEPLNIQLRNVYSRGRWFAWGRVQTTYSFSGGYFVDVEWSDDGGSTYHACGWGNRPSYVAYQNVSTYTKAFDWVRGRSTRVCVGSGANPRTHSGGYWVGCTRWFRS